MMRKLLVLLGMVCACFAFTATAGDAIPVGQLPAEAHATLDLIGRGGPFPYRRDGIIFNNFEQRLPLEPRGYYHEYTVPTPGSHDRGARRIITGGAPPVVFYYTGDHYRSFREIQR
jgi:ribonuclease T1